MNRQLRDLRKLASRYGFCVRMGGKHYVLVRGKTKVTTSITPSDRRVMKNLESQLKRLQQKGK